MDKTDTDPCPTCKHPFPGHTDQVTALVFKCQVKDCPCAIDIRS